MISIVILDGFAVEPYAVELRRDTFPANVEEPISILHLSDLHTHGFGLRERRVLDLLSATHPDVIVVTGDTVDDGSLEPARELFVHLSAPLGVWVVSGNWEHWKPPTNERAFYESVGAHLLVNEGHAVRHDVWVAGVDDPSSSFADIDAALSGADEVPGRLRVALFHAPELFDSVDAKVDFALAGHTHGGQVRLPLLGALWTPPGSGRFVQGWYAGKRARLFVSRGIGTSLVPIRFLCRPEVELLTLTPAVRSS